MCGRVRVCVPDLSAGGVGTEPGEQVEPYVPLDAHGSGVYAEDVSSPLQLRQTELHLPV